MPTKLSNHFVIQKPIGNLYRPKHAYILIADNDNQYYFGEKKNFYPDGIYRLIGGGLDGDEEPLLGAFRELEEETGLKPDPVNIVNIAEIEITASTLEGQKSMTAYLYYYKLQDDDKMVPADDISNIKSMTKDEFLDLITKFKDLNGEFCNDDRRFAWQDYGQIYGYIHQIAYDFINEL
jgi:8-oxo-dGTP pyrophosphatase MutT (NUDIX family)